MAEHELRAWYLLRPAECRLASRRQHLAARVRAYYKGGDNDVSCLTREWVVSDTAQERASCRRKWPYCRSVRFSANAEAARERTRRKASSVEEQRVQSNHPISITPEQRQAIDALLRRLAQRLEGALRDLSPRSQLFSHTTLELRQSHLAQVLEQIIAIANEPEASTYSAEKRARIRDQVQFVYQYLFIGPWSLAASYTYLIPEDFELDPVSELLHDVRQRLTQPGDLLTIEQAAELLGIARPMAYQWIDEGILHPLRVGPHKYRRCERWEINLVLRERGRADQVPLHVSGES